MKRDLDNFSDTKEEIDSTVVWERHVINDRSPLIDYKPIDDPLMEDNVCWFHANLGKHGRPVVEKDELEIWAKPLADGSMAALLLNDTAGVADMTVNWNEVAYNADFRLEDEMYGLRDLWQHEYLGAFVGSYTAADVPANGTVLLKVRRG